MTILLGAPGSAKTAFANQLAAQAECPALVVTTEMSPITLLHRHTARVTKTHAAKFRTGEIAPDLCRELFTRTIEEHLLIVLDSLHSWVRGSGMIAGGASEYTATSAAVSALQRIGAERECSVLVVSEQNRSNMGTDRQEAGADSRAIEYGAEVVIALSRERNAIPDADDEVPITATIAKNRDGSPGTTIDLRFCGRFMAFREGDGTANVVASAAGRGKFTSSAGNHNGKAMVD